MHSPACPRAHPHSRLPCPDVLLATTGVRIPSPSVPTLMLPCWPHWPGKIPAPTVSSTGHQLLPGLSVHWNAALWFMVVFLFSETFALGSPCTPHLWQMSLGPLTPCPTLGART